MAPANANNLPDACLNAFKTFIHARAKMLSLGNIYFSIYCTLPYIPSAQFGLTHHRQHDVVWYC